MCYERAAWTSAIAVAWGTPMPSTPRVVQAAPGPTPTRTATAPVRMRCSPVEYEAQPPTTTGTGTSRMNSLRLSGSEAVDTCPAELAHGPRGARGHDAVHGRRHHRQIEPVGAEGRGDVDVVGVARAPRGHDRDVVEAVRAAALLAPSDLYFQGGILGTDAD